MKKIGISLLCIGLLVVAWIGVDNRIAIRDWLMDVLQFEDPLPTANRYFPNSNVVINSDLGNINTNTDVQIPAQNTNTIVTLPDAYMLDVPFTTQAPYANWDFPYQEACEEASSLTVHFYYTNQTFTPDIADKEILDLVEWEKGYFGDYKDTTAQETADMIKTYFSYDRVEVIADPSIDDIKKEIYAGRPVIVPAAGKQLGNPNFRNGGPLYHMFVIRGYTKNQFITNDVGTRNGENYRYDFQTVMDAMHDWNNGDVANGAKRIIVVYPNV